MDEGKLPPGTVCIMCHAPQGRMTAGPKGAICEQCVIDAANALYPQAAAPQELTVGGFNRGYTQPVVNWRPKPA